MNNSTKLGHTQVLCNQAISINQRKQKINVHKQMTASQTIQNKKHHHFL